MLSPATNDEQEGVRSAGTALPESSQESNAAADTPGPIQPSADPPAGEGQVQRLSQNELLIQIVSYVEDLKHVSRNLASKDARITELQNEVNSLAEKFVAARQESIAKELDSQESQTDVARASAEVARSKLLLKHEEDRVAMVTKEKDKFRELYESGIEKFSNDRNRWEQMEAELRAENASLKHQVAELQMSTTQTYSRWEAFQEQKFASEQELLERAVTAEKKSESKGRAYDLMSANWQDCSIQLEAAHETIANLTAQSQELTDQRAKAKVKISELEARLNSYEAAATAQEGTDDIPEAVFDSGTLTPHSTDLGASSVLSYGPGRISDQRVSDLASSFARQVFKMSETDLNSAHALLVEQLYGLMTQRDSLQGDIKQLNSSLRQLDAHCADLPDENADELRDHLAASEERVSALSCQLEAVKRDFDRQEALVSRLQMQNEQTSQRADILKSHCDKQDQIISALAHERDTKVEELRTVTAQMLQPRLSEGIGYEFSPTEAIPPIAEYHQMVKENSDLRLKIVRLERHEETESQVTVTKLKSQIAEWESKLNLMGQEFEEKLNVLRTERDELTRNRDVLTTKLAEITTAKSVLEESVKFMVPNAEHQKVTDDCESYKARIISMSETLKTSLNGIKDAKEAFAELQGKNALANLQIEYLKSNSERDTERIKSLVTDQLRHATEMRELESKVRTGVAEVDRLNESLRGTERVAADRLTSLEEARVKCRGAEAYCTQIQDRLQALSSDHTRQLTAWQQELARVNVALEREQAQFKALNQRYKEDILVYQHRLLEERERCAEGERLRRSSETQMDRPSILEDPTVQPTEPFSEPKTCSRSPTIAKATEDQQQVAPSRSATQAGDLDELVCLRDAKAKLAIRVADLESHNKAQSEATAKTRAEVDYWQAQCTDLQAELTKLREQIGLFDVSARNSEDQITALNEKLSGTAGNESGLTVKVAQLEQELKSANEEHERLQIEVTELKVAATNAAEKSNLAAQALMDQLGIKSGELDEMRLSYQRAVQNHNRDIELVQQLKEERIDLQSRLNSEEDENRKLSAYSKSKIASLQEEATHAKNAADGAMEDVRRLQQDNAAMTKMLNERLTPDTCEESVKSRIRELGRIKEILELHLQDAKSQLQKAELEKSTLASKVGTLEEQVQLNMEKVEKLTSELMAVRQTFDHGKLVEIETLRNQVKNFRAERLSLLEQRREAERICSEEQTQNAPLREEIQKLTAEKMKMRIETQTFKEFAEESQRSYTQLAQTFEGKDPAEFETLSKLSEQLQNKLAATEKEAQDLRLRLEKSEIRVVSTRGENSKMKGKLLILTKEKQQAADELERTKAQLALLQKTPIVADEAETQRLQTIINNYRQQLSKQSSSYKELQAQFQAAEEKLRNADTMKSSDAPCSDVKRSEDITASASTLAPAELVEQIVKLVKVASEWQAIALAASAHSRNASEAMALLEQKLLVLNENKNSVDAELASAKEQLIWMRALTEVVERAPPTADQMDDTTELSEAPAEAPTHQPLADSADNEMEEVPAPEGDSAVAAHQDEVMEAAMISGPAACMHDAEMEDDKRVEVVLGSSVDLGGSRGNDCPEAVRGIQNADKVDSLTAAGDGEVDPIASSADDDSKPGGAPMGTVVETVSSDGTDGEDS